MSTPSIYQFVENKLVKHGVEKTKDGLLILSDKDLFKLFVDLERAARAANFDRVQSATHAIENHVVSMGKRHLMAFVHMYIRFSECSPKRTEADEYLADGSVRKSMVFARAVSDEERLIGLWARVKEKQQGEAFLRVVYADP